MDRFNEEQEVESLRQQVHTLKMDEQKKSEMRTNLIKHAQKKRDRNKLQKWIILGGTIAAVALFSVISFTMFIDNDQLEQATKIEEESEVTASEIVETIEVEGENGDYRVRGVPPEDVESFEYAVMVDGENIANAGDDVYNMTHEMEGSYSFTLNLSVEESLLPNEGELLFSVKKDDTEASVVLEEFEQLEDVEGTLSVEEVSVDPTTILIEGMEEDTEVTTYDLQPYDITYQMDQFLSHVEVGDDSVTHHNNNDEYRVEVTISVIEDQALNETQQMMEEQHNISESPIDLSQFETAFEGYHQSVDIGEGYFILEINSDVLMIEYSYSIEAGDGIWPRLELLINSINQ
ncbi:hypothetical protein [Alkalibacillus haloalkaliphilus]|uniref:Uncharacterized protein n=1 Tax=Alkalibacillus haloalkaliphilus TaxID=94136 RepID=A0A511W4U9_9BACI|nr:hypothetical protein [Alkalibacillus haloalkaliphilus]GEN46105.1 hypothetical protein AHA02nite_18810 [Alkalibacillus haloalkaliphilus]